MDKFGQGVEFQYSMLQRNKELSFEGFNRQMLLEMCILSGCDYLQSLPGMGLKRAHAIIKRFKSYDKVSFILDKHIYFIIKFIFLIVQSTRLCLHLHQNCFFNHEIIVNL